MNRIDRWLTRHDRAITRGWWVATCLGIAAMMALLLLRPPGAAL